MTKELPLIHAEQNLLHGWRGPVLWDNMPAVVLNASGMCGEFGPVATIQLISAGQVPVPVSLLRMNLLLPEVTDQVSRIWFGRSGVTLSCGSRGWHLNVPSMGGYKCVAMQQEPREGKELTDGRLHVPFLAKIPCDLPGSFEHSNEATSWALWRYWMASGGPKRVIESARSGQPPLVLEVG